MRLKKNGDIPEKIIWTLTVLIFASFSVFETYLWGKYISLVMSVLLLLISAAEYGFKLQIRMGAYQYFSIAFMVFALCSALWAMDSGDALTTQRTLFRVLLCSCFLYWHYVRKSDTFQLLNAVMWSGYIIAIYSIAFYGLDTVILATAGASTRLANDYSNVNTIGMACALSCIMCFWGILYKKFRWLTAAPLLPTLLVMAATQSRKAILFVAGGVSAIAFLRYSTGKNLLNKCLKALLSVLAILAALYIASSLEIFSGVNERLTGLLNMFTGEGKVDGSTLTRKRMISLGIEWWLKYPVAGIGIGNPHILAAHYLNFDAYLHNNYVELLCGGGLIGFSLYYSRYVYLFMSLWKYRDADREYFSIYLVWLLLMLAMDFAMVSYYSKSQSFYFMIHFINIECLKRKSRGIIYGDKEAG